jgi:hypothetical protein
MNMDDLKRILNKAISDTWVLDVKKDYENNFLLYDDSLKCYFYYNLRNRLGKEILQQYNLRIISKRKNSSLSNLDFKNKKERY